MHAQPPGGDESDPADLGPVDALLHQCLQTPEPERASTIERLCREHPDHAATLRRRLLLLVDAGFTTLPANGPAPARPFGEYRLLRQLGEGGMGVVWLAEQERLQRQVALKLVRADQLLQPHARERLRREALALSRLQHPCICPLHDVGEVDGTPYLAMRYVEGETLAQRLTRERAESVALPRSRDAVHSLLRLAEQVAQALHAAHEAGLVHRDVKPGNIMLSLSGEPIVLDFGLAHDESTAFVTLTRSGDQVGTPAYMSPEQIDGHGKKPDRRTDVYSLAVTLYEALTLRRPFQGRNREEIYRAILTASGSVSSRDLPGVDQDLRIVLEKAMAPERGHRYASAAEFAEDLRRVRGNEPIRARRTPWWLRLRRWAQRNPVAATFLLGLTVALGGAGFLLRQLDAELNHSRALRLAGASAEAGKSGATLSLLLAQAAVNIEASPATISQLHAAVAGACEVAQFRHPSIVHDARFSPDGQTLLTCSDGGEVKILRQQEDGKWQEVCDMPTVPGVRCIAFVPDGSAFVTGSHHVQLWSLDGTPLQDLGATHGQAVQLEFSADGLCLLVAVWAKHALLFHRDGATWSEASKPIDLPHGGPAGHGGFAHRHDDLLVTGTGFGETETPSRDFTARLWQRDGTPAGVLEGHQDALTAARFAPDDEVVLTASRDNTVKLWDWRRQTCLADLSHGAWVMAVDFAPKGDRFATGSTDSTVRIWDRTGMPKAVSHHPGPVWLVGYSVDGQRLVTGTYGGLVRVLDADGRVLGELTGHEAKVWSVDFSPNDQSFVTSAWDDTARVWLLDWDDLPVFRGHVGTVEQVTYHSGVATTIGYDGTLRTWDASGTQLGQLDFGTPLGHVDVARQGDRAVVLSRDGRAWLRTLDGAAAIPLPVAGAAQAAAFSPDGKHVVVGSTDECAHVFDAAGNAGPTFGKFGERVYAVAWLDDRTIAAATWGGIVSAFDLDGRGEPLWKTPLRPNDRQQWLATSLDRSLLVVTSKDGRAAILSRDGQVLFEIECAEAVLTTAEFSPDGTLLVTASRDGARLWDLRSEPPGALLCVLRSGHDGAATSAVFSPDGARVLTSSSDSTVRTSVVHTADLLLLAKRRAFRDFTDVERARFPELQSAGR